MVSEALGLEDIEPCLWDLPDIAGDPVPWMDQEAVGSGAVLDETTVLNAYTLGIFPMPIEGQLCWFSPLDRGVLPLNGFRVTKSLKRSMRRYRVSLNRVFEAVITRCATLERPGAWINDEVIETYSALHQSGWAHSVEVWDDNGDLVGGLYGVQIGGFFAGESMFYTATDASKVGVAALVELLNRAGVTLLDTQWQTKHLKTLGVIQIDRADYLRKLSCAIRSKATSLTSTALLEATDDGTTEYIFDFASHLRWLDATATPLNSGVMLCNKMNHEV